MSKYLCGSRHYCHLGLLMLAILAGYAAQPMTDRLARADIHAEAPASPCVT